jgi:hypothetical protein
LQTGSIIFHVAKAVACEKSNLSPFVPVRNSAWSRRRAGRIWCR